ncbi:MAG TPA: hypothetical protein VGN01_05295 [Acidobacteriaceae bacterium]|jgi:hypothetical protein
MKVFWTALLLAVPSVSLCQAIPFEQKGPIASLTASGSYIDGEPQGGHRHSLWGWSAVPEIKLTRHFGMQAEFASYYMRSIYPGQNRFLMAAGPRYDFSPVSRITPFIFAEGGEMRLTFKNTLYRDWDPIVKGGVGFEYRLSRSIAITVVPAEYLAHNEDFGAWDKDFTARGGITFNLYR